MRHPSRRLDPGLALLCSQTSVEPYSPKGPESVRQRDEALEKEDSTDEIKKHTHTHKKKKKKKTTAHSSVSRTWLVSHVTQSIAVRW